MAHSRFVIAAHVKGVPDEQRNELTLNYNQAVLKWDSDFGLHSIRLRTLFDNGETIKRLAGVYKLRVALDGPAPRLRATCWPQAAQT